jgi:N-acetylglucosaminyldiphosphoundecaprenol N-acetyl-beta-D-mannosaminyltransferase
MERIKVLGSPMDAGTMAETVEFIDNRISQRQFTQHVVVNVAKLVNMVKDKFLRVSVVNCDIINIDGMGVVWGARFLGHKIPERVAGVDLFLQLIKLSAEREYPVFLLGAKDEIVQETARKLRAEHPGLKIVGAHHGYFWDDEKKMVDNIRNSGARLLFVAITSPKKEIFINSWQHQLGVDFVMGVGGTFDVVAGKVKRAPEWMQKFGMEWLYRVIQEPRRMWKRYLVTNSKFLIMLIREKILSYLKSTKY